MKKVLVLMVGLLALDAPCWALETTQAHVTLVEATYMPGRVQFQLDAGTPSCPAGTWVAWANSNTDNNKSVYALLLAAVSSGKEVQIFFNNGETSCTAQFVYALSF